ncbi:Cation efflux family protein [Legionella birminghamensis]|uniref:Cation efflux family protein n=1 Tax=Legionella birminghamensis TaxID=28083 RepID=A0A378IBU6_9GAMM|nr:cation diffusion facilitator family transporter [Legionella birminghamensis]KTC67777.1 Cation efflux family protein [Legionella birminghamensis]STX32041.1 Predicted Co/Zn/Cd cation transporters [Legionella birminghamensis]
MLHITKDLEFPAHLNPLYAKAIKYEWISFFYMISATFFSFMAMSNSQTMKTVWLEDMLGIIPPASFLLASRIIRWKANKNFPYGYHKITGMSYFTSSMALFVLGIFLLIDGASVLIKQEHPSIPDVHIAGYSIWMGFIMMIALLWSSIPSTILGHIKIPLAHKLYDKILFADSKMNKASWMSGFASIIGIAGIGVGFWWADASIAILISLSILNDGYSNLKYAILDLMDEVPKTIEKNKTDPLISAVKSILKQEDWVKSFEIRFRVVGHLFFGDIFIISDKKMISPEKIQALRNKIEQHHWRLHDITITVLSDIHKSNSSGRSP